MQVPTREAIVLDLKERIPLQVKPDLTMEFLLTWDQPGTYLIQKINLLRYRLENSLHQTTLVSEITLTNHLNSDKIQIQDNLQIKDKTLTIELPAITGQIVDQSLLMGQRQCSHTSLNLFHLQIQGGSLCMRDSMVKVGQPE